MRVGKYGESHSRVQVTWKHVRWLLVRALIQIRADAVDPPPPPSFRWEGGQPA